MSQVQGREIASGPMPPLIDDERAELERLRQENLTLRTSGRPPRRRVRWRSVIAAVLLVLGCLLAPLSLVAVWTHNQISDTDRFVATTAPLITDPAVQQAITNRVTTTVFEYVHVEDLTNEAIDALAAQSARPELVQRLHDLTPTLASGVTGFVHDKVEQLVAGPQFAAAWNQAVRMAHEQAVTVLSGDSRAIVVKGDTIYLDLAPFIDAAKQRLSAEGLTIVDRIPEVHPTIAIAPADQLVRAQSAYTALDTAATVLPWITLLLLAAGVYLARNRMRALVGVGLGIAVALTVLARRVADRPRPAHRRRPTRRCPRRRLGLRHHRAIPSPRRPCAVRPGAGRCRGRIPGRFIGHRGRNPTVVLRPTAPDPRRPLTDRSGGHLGTNSRTRSAHRRYCPRRADLHPSGSTHRSSHPHHRHRAAHRACPRRVPRPTRQPTISGTGRVIHHQLRRRRDTTRRTRRRHLRAAGLSQFESLVHVMSSRMRILIRGARAALLG